MKLKSILLISTICAGNVAIANHPLVNKLKSTIIENINFFKQTNRSNEDVCRFVTTQQTLKELIHELSLTRINRKELTLLVATQTYLQDITLLIRQIEDILLLNRNLKYINNYEFDIDAHAVKPWIKENRKKIFSHINAFDLLITQWSTLAL